MIVYGVCIGSRGTFEALCRPSLPDNAVVLTRRSQRSIFAAYNSILDEASSVLGVEAVALIHDDVEVGSRFETDVREAMATGAGVIGAVGASSPRSIAWWEGATAGYAVEPSRTIDFGGGTHEVDTIDGFAMVLSASCASQVRFDEYTYSGFHAYDIDYCFEARRAGYRICVAPLDLVHHLKGTYGDMLAYRRADIAWRRKWRRGNPVSLFGRRLLLRAASSLAGRSRYFYNRLAIKSLLPYQADERT